MYDKKIVILGYSFKANTNDTRNSPSIEICRKLLKEGCCLIINDPKVREKEVYDSLFENDLKDKNREKVIFQPDIDKAIQDAHAIIILTDWEVYKDLNWESFYSKMCKPAWIFDTRSVLPKDIKNTSKLNFWELGNS